MTPQAHDPHEELGAAVREAAASVHAPAGLRAHVEAEQRRRHATGRRPQILAGALATGLAAATVAVVALITAGDEPPAVAAAVRLALSAPTGPAPAVDPTDEAHVDASIGSVRFPNYDHYTPKWRTIGVRRDRLDGRHAVTVSYRVRDTTIGYTIVDGSALKVPASARRIEAGGLRLAVVQHRGATVVTWRRDGLTCVLAGRGASLRMLERLATWT